MDAGMGNGQSGVTIGKGLELGNLTPVRLVMARERDKDFLEINGSGSVAFGTSPILASEFLSTWPASETPELVVV